MSIERRKQPRRPILRTQPEISLSLGNDKLGARLVDSNDEGFGLETAKRLEVGSRVRLKGQLLTGAGSHPLDVDASVRWSVPGRNGCFLAGVMIDRPAPSHGVRDGGEQDYYEVLQLSPKADPDTIHRVFRALAQRFHPDNGETGDEAWFKVLMQAYEALSDPRRRASYDARRPEREQARWKIFGSAEAARGVEAERRKRHAVLSLLYVRRAHDSTSPAMSLHDFEDLLGCPREHLAFALWFLKENAWVTRSDNGRFSITAKGVERAEELGDHPLPPENRMIEAGVR